MVDADPSRTKIRAVHQNRNNAENSAVQVVPFVQCTVDRHREAERRWKEGRKKNSCSQMQLLKLFSRQLTLPRLRAVHQNRNKQCRGEYGASFLQNQHTHLRTQYCSLFLIFISSKWKKQRRH